MCGITAFFARESSIEYKHLDTLFSWSEKRGKDGFGYVLIRKQKNGIRDIYHTFRDHRPYSECKSEVKRDIKLGCGGLKIGDLIIAISRAAPETEGMTDVSNLHKTMQPIVSEKYGGSPALL